MRPDQFIVFSADLGPGADRLFTSKISMRIPPSKKGHIIIACAALALLLILALIAGLQTCRQIKGAVEKTVNKSIDNNLENPSIPVSLTITAHDIATKKNSDSLENVRMQLHTDAVAQPALQPWLDSLYNDPDGYAGPYRN